MCQCLDQLVGDVVVVHSEEETKRDLRNMSLLDVCYALVLCSPERLSILEFGVCP